MPRLPKCYYTCLMRVLGCEPGSWCSSCSLWEESHPLQCDAIDLSSSLRDFLMRKPLNGPEDLKKAHRQLLATVVLNYRKEKGLPMLPRIDMPTCYETCAPQLASNSASRACVRCADYKLALIVAHELASVGGPILNGRPTGNDGTMDNQQEAYKDSQTFTRCCTHCKAAAPAKRAVYVACRHSVCCGCMERAVMKSGERDRCTVCGRCGPVTVLYEEALCFGETERVCTECIICQEKPGGESAFWVMCSHVACVECMRIHAKQPKGC